MKSIIIITFFFILALTTGCKDEYLDYNSDMTAVSETFTIIVKNSPYNDLKFYTEIVKYEYGKEREILLEGELKFYQCNRKESYHQATFIVTKENNPQLYEELLNNKVQCVVTSNFKMILKFMSDIELEVGRNEIDFSK